jgi:ribosome-associated protein
MAKSGRHVVELAELRPWITVRASRSPGPGGQNVNKVNTRVTVLLDVRSCEVLSDAEKRRILRALRTRISHDGVLRVVSGRHRTQRRNREAAEERLIELLGEAVRRKKARRPTRPTAASRERRLAAKRQRGETKERRKPPRND